MTTGFKWIWIDKETLNNKELTPQEKIIYAFIKSISKSWDTYASNSWFTNALWIPDRSVTRCLTQLKSKGYINRINDKNIRKVNTESKNKSSPDKITGHKYKLPTAKLSPHPAKMTSQTAKMASSNYNIYNKYNKKNITSFSYICEYGNRHSCDEWCNCYKIFWVSYFKFWEYLNNNWFKVSAWNQITSDMQNYFKNNYSANG